MAKEKTAEDIFREFYTEAMKIDAIPLSWVRIYVESSNPDPNKDPILYNKWTNIVYRLHAHHVVIAYNPIDVQPITDKDVRQLYRTDSPPVATIDLFDRVMKDDSIRINPHYGKPLTLPGKRKYAKYETLEEIMERLQREEELAEAECERKKKPNIFSALFNFITMK